MKSCSSSTRKKPKKKRLTSFLHKFSKFQHLQGLMTFLITRNGKAVLEISRSDVDRYNSSFAVKMANFETFILFILFILLLCHTQWITSRIKTIINRLTNIKFKICALFGRSDCGGEISVKPSLWGIEVSPHGQFKY